jgi:hypothetical protein
MIQNFNEQQQANAISSGTYNSAQWCLTINDKVQKNESTMDIKHASACAWNFFLSFFLLFSFEQIALKVSREYMCQASMLKRK